MRRHPVCIAGDGRQEGRQIDCGTGLGGPSGQRPKLVKLQPVETIFCIS
jgi:hypothetical protein